MLGDHGEAEDVAQETFMRLWGQRYSIESDPRAVTAWVYRTATRLAIDRLRGRGRGAQSSPPPMLDRRDPEVLTMARRSLRALAQVLPERELEVAILSRIDGLDQREIAEVVGASERTVRRMLRRLDARLGALDEEPS